MCGVNESIIIILYKIAGGDGGGGVGGGAGGGAGGAGGAGRGNGGRGGGHGGGGIEILEAIKTPKVLSGTCYKVFFATIYSYLIVNKRWFK